MSLDWFIWRPVARGLATLTEVEREWTLIDILDAHELLDVMDESDEWGRRNIK